MPKSIICQSTPSNTKKTQGVHIEQKNTKLAVHLSTLHTHTHTHIMIYIINTKPFNVQNYYQILINKLIKQHSNTYIWTWFPKIFNYSVGGKSKLVYK